MMMRYTDLMTSAPGSVGRFTKLAQMDVQEEQLEQDFSKLAYMFVADKAAQLMRYVLGFEVVEHEPDGSKAVGIFGFKVGRDYYYIPAFFITNQVKGVDMVFSKRTNMFFPLTEGWVDSIIQRDSIELGDAADSKDTQADFENPDFDFVRSPRIGASYGSKTAESYDEYEDGKSLFKAAWDAMCRTTAEKLKSDKEMQAALAGFVGAVNGKELSKKAGAGVLQQWMSEKGGPSSVSALFDVMCANVKFANAALSVYPDVETMHVHRFSNTAVGCGKRAEAQLRIVSDHSKAESDSDKAKVLSNGFYIEDKRDPASLSKVYDFDYVSSFGSHDGPGKYDVLTSDGTTQPAWILQTSKATGCVRDLVVTDPEGVLSLRGVCSGDAYVKGEKRTAASGLHETAIPLMQMETGSTYILVDRDGKNVVPGFRVTGSVYRPGENVKVDGYFTWFYDSYDSCVGSKSTSGSDFDVYRASRFRDRDGHLRSSPPDNSISGITLTNNVGKAMRAGDRILIPSNYKAVLVDAPYDNKARVDERQPKISLGTPVDLKFGMKSAEFHTVRVMADGPEYYVRVDDLRVSSPMGYKQACMSLTGRLGLSVRDTEEILAKAAESRDVSTNIHFGKAAQFVGVGMPAPAPQSPGIDPYSGVPVYGPYETETTGGLVGAPPPPHGNPYGENLGGEGETQQGASPDSAGSPGANEGAAPVDQQAMDLAAQAAQVGQRHVFDYAAIGGLARVYDTGALIDSYIPQFMQSVDRLGRILFLYYWKNEDFGERYGTSDTVELEDTLRSVFKQFGNLALKLRQKTIDSDSE